MGSMADNLERTDVYQQHHEHVTGEVPVVQPLADDAVEGWSADDLDDLVGLTPDWLFDDDDTPLTCGIENPDICESCT